MMSPAMPRLMDRSIRGGLSTPEFLEAVNRLPSPGNVVDAL